MKTAGGKQSDITQEDSFAEMVEENLVENDEAHIIVEKDVPMSYMGHTLEFPRKDNVYKKKEALPYDEADSLVWRRAFKNDWKENLLVWSIYILGGIGVGVTAFSMSKLEEFLVNSNRKLLQFIIDSNIGNPSFQLLYPLLAYCGFAAVLGLLAGLLTVYYGPGANGSGVAEMIGYMNGVNYPQFIGIPTLITKIFGVTLAVSSRLCIGKEGPLAHIGSIMGLLPIYLPFESMKRYRNDVTKRELIAAGGSSGVAAAFGAPIGGALFAYEMSKPTSFWSFKMIWKTFITCSLAVLLLGILQTLAEGDLGDGFAGSTIKFGNISGNNKFNSFQNLIAAILIGVVGGLMGAFFVGVNFKVNVWRKNWIAKKWQKPIETSIWSIMTSLFFIVAPYLMWLSSNGTICQQMSNLSTDQMSRVYQGWCPKNQFDPNLSLFLSTEGDIIKNIMDKNVYIEYWHMMFFLLIWYFFTITTYGTFVPAGLFLPGMIIGCALGQVLFMTMDQMTLIYGTNEERLSINKAYIVLGCAGFMAGYTRMTYSLAVIIMETSNDISIFVPIMMTITVSNYIGYFFTRSLYERAIRGKQMPLIRDWIPEPNKNLIAENLMSKKVVSLQNLCKLSDLKLALETTHHAFPVLNTKGNFVGLIPRNFLLVLLNERNFYGSNQSAEQAKEEDSNSSAVEDPRNFFKQNMQSQVSTQSGIGRLSYKLRHDQMQDSNQALEYFNQYYDLQKYPQTPPDQILCWTKFIRDLNSVDMPVTKEHLQICDMSPTALLDLRPYMIENPMRVMTTDYLFKCVEYMRKFHMRHIPVLHPTDGSLKGIITRRDLFKWLDS